MYDRRNVSQATVHIGPGLSWDKSVTDRAAYLFAGGLQLCFHDDPLVGIDLLADHLADLRAEVLASAEAATEPLPLEVAS